ncbi:MAG: UbiA family prenyltransferase [Verrucomicrobiales bacterium]
MEPAAENQRNRARVMLELGRVSNLPTVWSNVTAGWILAGGTWDWRLIFLLVGGSLLYTAGMFLNDAFDANWDRIHRPERPIPSGRVSANVVGIAGIFMLMMGAAFVTGSFIRTYQLRQSIIALSALVACILLYTWLHKKTAGSVVLMALCRFFLVFVSAVAVAPQSMDDPAAKWSVLVATYVLGITLLARGEARSITQRGSDAASPRLQTRLDGVSPHLGSVNESGSDAASPRLKSARSISLPGAICLAAPALCAGLIFPLAERVWVLFLVFALGWVAFGLRILDKRDDEGRIGRAVAHALAGLVVMDALAISFVNPPCAVAVVALLPFTLWLQRRIPAT